MENGFQEFIFKVISHDDSDRDEAAVQPPLLDTLSEVTCEVKQQETLCAEKESFELSEENDVVKASEPCEASKSFSEVCLLDVLLFHSRIFVTRAAIFFQIMSSTFASLLGGFSKFTTSDAEGAAKSSLSTNSVSMQNPI